MVVKLTMVLMVYAGICLGLSVVGMIASVILKYMERKEKEHKIRRYNNHEEQ